MYNVNDTVTIDGLQSHFDLKVIFAFTQVVKEWEIGRASCRERVSAEV